MRVYDASTRISAEFGGIRDLSRHLSLNFMLSPEMSKLFFTVRSILKYASQKGLVELFSNLCHLMV